MSLIQEPVPGLPITWAIGNRQTSTFDEHPGILLRPLEYGTDDRGREGTVAFVMLLRHNLEGEAYLQPARILERYIDDRFDTVVGLDATEDGTKLEPADLMKAYGAQRKDFFVSGRAAATAPITVGTKATKVADTDSPDLPV